MVDNRNNATRRREGIVFRVVYSDHHIFYKTPFYRCSIEWNKLDVPTSLLEGKTEFKNALKGAILNPYAKVLYDNGIMLHYCIDLMYYLFRLIPSHLISPPSHSNGRDRIG